MRGPLPNRFQAALRACCRGSTPNSMANPVEYKFYVKVNLYKRASRSTITNTRAGCCAQIIILYSLSKSLYESGQNDRTSSALIIVRLPVTPAHGSPFIPACTLLQYEGRLEVSHTHKQLYKGGPKNH